MARPPAAPPHRLVFFDVDGTLVPGTSSSAFLAERLGHTDALVAAEAAYAAGRLDNDEVCHLDARGWAGHRRSDVRRWLTELPLVDGIEETLAWCRERSVEPYLATLAWSDVGDHLVERFGFRGSCGPALAQVDGRYTGFVESVFDEHLKRDYAAGIAAELGVPPQRCAAVGDSRSDLPLFGSVGLSIAFNADEATRAVATTTVDSPDLRSVIPVLERWLGGD